MRLPALLVAASLLGLATAQATPAPSPYPIHRQYQRGETLVIEHTPVRAVAVRRVRRGKAVVIQKRVRRARVVRRSTRVIGSVLPDERVFWTGAIAGGCRDGGLVRRRVGHASVVLQREVCGSIAPGLFPPSAVVSVVPRRDASRVRVKRPLRP